MNGSDVAGSIKDRVVAFLHLFENDCLSCFRRIDYNCRSCRSTIAKRLLNELNVNNRSNNNEIDCSLAARISKVLSALKTANRPLASSEIDMSGMATPQLKEWTLMKMIKIGVIRRDMGEKCYLYQLVKKDEQNGETK